MVCVIWQWSVRGTCSQPGLDGWATLALPALQEPMDLGIPNTMKKGGQEVVWRWQLKAAIQPVNLLLLGWLYSSLVPYQSYLLITYQPVLRIFDNFLVSVSFSAPVWDLAQVCWLRREGLPAVTATAGVASVPGRVFCSVLLGFLHLCFFQPSSLCLWILWNLYFETYLLFWK